MKGKDGKTLYVGKSVNLKNRVSSYFNKNSDYRFFISRLPRELDEIEIITTSSEREALLLENNLIKELHPKYNILLRDDKSYLSLRINLNEDFPRFETIRGLHENNSFLYFGPYHSARTIRSIKSFLEKYFKLRTCSNRKFKSRKRPCLRFYMNRCDAPCVKDIPKNEYRDHTEDAILFLRGQTTKLVKKLTNKMNRLAEELRFEEAADLRDLISSLKELKQQQDVITSDYISLDILGFAKNQDRLALIILEVRKGALKTHRQVILETTLGENSEIIESYLSQHYILSHILPEQIIVPISYNNLNLLQDFIKYKTGKSLIFKHPTSQHEHNLLKLANNTAINKLILTGNAKTEEQLDQLVHLLKLKKSPKKIECYDISHLQGKFTVGSMVVFINGKPKTNKYRIFNVKTTNIGDDFAALREVIRRRLLKKDEPDWSLPDLIVIDGGKGQLSSVYGVMQDLNVVIPLISLAKERNKDGPPDRFFKPGAKEPIFINSKGRELFLLAQLRDEAHRFAIENHRNKRISDKFKTELTNIKGIGQKTIKKLLIHFGSIDEIAKASKSDLIKIEGIGKYVSQQIINYFKSRI